MNNPFKKGDKVTVKIKGQVVEATVAQTWSEEVQVRTADKKLIWRVPKTITLVEAAPEGAAEASTPEPAAEAVPEPAGEPPAAPQQDRYPLQSYTVPAESNGEDQSQPTPEPQEAHRKPILYKRTRGRGNKRRKI